MKYVLTFTSKDGNNTSDLIGSNKELLEAEAAKRNQKLEEKGFEDVGHWWVKEEET